MNTDATIELITAGLRVGLAAYEQACRLSAEGYELPSLEEFEARTQALRDLPDLTPADGEEG